jgi:hypothetical protein
MVSTVRLSTDVAFSRIWHVNSIMDPNKHFFRKALKECLISDIYEGKQKVLQMLDNMTQNNL